MRLVPLLVEAGHVVAGMTRTEAKADSVRALGAEPVVWDVFDAEALRAAVVAFAPDAVVHELTDLPDDPALIPERPAATTRTRREGTRNLIDTARAAGAPRFLAQSVAWELPGEGGVATAELGSAVLAVGGAVLRYGQFHGPGTYFESTPPPPPRVHVDEAARRAVEAFDARSGVVTVVDPD